MESGAVQHGKNMQTPQYSYSLSETVLMQARCRIGDFSNGSSDKQPSSVRRTVCDERSRAMQQQMKVIKEAIISIINMLDLLWPTD